MDVLYGVRFTGPQRAARTGTPPCRLDIAELDAPLIAAFLDHIEHQRGNCIRTRRARLAAIRFPVRLRRPASPRARRRHRQGPGHSCPGRRDHAWILLAIQTGLRASEITSLTCKDVHLGTVVYVACHGKDRITPLTPGTVTTLRAWLAERAGRPDDPLFDTIRGGPMSHDALQQRLTLHAAAAGQSCPALTSKTSRPTSCGTPRPWHCCAPGPTSPSSPSG